MLAIGISDLRHDSAAAAVDGTGAIAAFEEAKLNRLPGAGGMPQLALAYCLQHTGVPILDVSAVGITTRSATAFLRESVRLGLAGPLGTDVVGLGVDAASRRPLIAAFDHHLCHAASAFFASDFDRALVLTLDESGEGCSGLVAIGDDTGIHPIRSLRLTNSVGWIYSQATELLGFQARRDEHKTQWLSRRGTPDFIDVFRDMFGRNGAGVPVIDRTLRHDKTTASPFAAEFCRTARIDRCALPRDEGLRASLARSAQDFLEETVVRLAEHFRRSTKTTRICVAGGVMLNILLVRAIEERTGFDSVFVQPAAGNAGTALGAAYLAQRQRNGHVERRPLRDLYLGPESSSADIKPVLDNCKIVYKYLPAGDRLVTHTAQLLHQHRAVAWYQGRSEFGHRALGNRAIVASPFSPYVIDNLNRFIKHREEFHPFALSVPQENAAEFFDYTDGCRFMASLGRLKQPVPALAQFAIGNGRVRLHVVEKNVNPRFWSLLRKFGEEAPAPILVNTSFNLFGQPLVCDPREAIRSLYCAGTDALAIGDFLIVK